MKSRSDPVGVASTDEVLGFHGIAIETLEADLVKAGLDHELSWAQVKRIIDQLPVVEDGCRWCRGRLDRFGGNAWLCASCGRIDTDWHRAGEEVAS